MDGYLFFIAFRAVKIRGNSLAVGLFPEEKAAQVVGKINDTICGKDQSLLPQCLETDIGGEKGWTGVIGKSEQIFRLSFGNPFFAIESAVTLAPMG